MDMQSEAEGSPPAYPLELLSAWSTPVVLVSVSPACEQATGREGEETDTQSRRTNFWKKGALSGFHGCCIGDSAVSAAYSDRIASL